ncbi:MAG: sulfatase-like hydrolase/transferase [bacterium]|nr:sulfatase-like hydrolase/transferase [bacterium]
MPSHRPAVIRLPRVPSALAAAFLIAAAGAKSLAAQDSAVGDGVPRPNVVVIVSDDQGWCDIGCHNPAVWSPRLDELAASGVRFAQAYAMPQCTPTRVALMTGRYPSRFGGAAMQASNAPAFPRGTPTLAATCRSAGYFTALSGKWHLGSAPEHGPNHFGFDSSYGSLTGAVGMYDHHYRKGRFARTWHRDHEFLEDDENGVHATDLVTNEAVRVIENAGDRPFFLYVPFHSVHTPLDERGPFPERPTQRDPIDPSRWLDEDLIEWFHDPEGRIQAEPDPEKRLFLAAVHHLDHAVGRIVDALEQAGLRERTMIVFTSDNGPQVNWGGNAYPDDLRLTDFNQPAPLRGQKLDVYEGGIRVPAFVSWPGTIAPRVEQTPVHVVDWLPTISRLLGQAVSVPHDGCDLTGLLLRREALPERSLYWTWSQRTNRWALRRGRWKIVKYGRGAPKNPKAWALFDLERDPNERRDLRAEHPDIVTALHEAFVAERTRDRQR